MSHPVTTTKKMIFSLTQEKQHSPFKPRSLSFDSMQFCGRIPTFQRSMLPPLHPEDGGGMDL
jgi:hypothetical protein